MKQVWWPLAVLTTLALAALALALAWGSQPLGWRALWQALVGLDGGTGADIVWQLRLPRAMAAFGCGALLALAGALLQALLRNPLAEPYVLGVSGGASVGALLALWAGLGTVWIGAGASAGALAATTLVFLLGARAFRRHADSASAGVQLLLVGVVLGAGFGAIVSFILSVAPDRELRSMVFWMLGDLSAAQPYSLALAAAAAAVAAAVRLAPDLNLLLIGDAEAYTLGVDVRRLRWQVVVVASLAAGVAITVGGSIGFVGLVVPHALRLLLGHDQRLLLPASALAGGSLLVLADTLARSLFAPVQLPVGVVTALVGVPTFLALLVRGARTRGLAGKGRR